MAAWARGLMLCSLLLAVECAPAARRTRLVVHVGNDPRDLARFERWLGCPVDGVAVHTGQADWADWAGSIGFELALWRGSARTIYWSIPLLPEHAALAAVAAGAADARYRAAARELVAGTPGHGPIDVRTGWEFNTAYMPWRSHGQEAAYVGAFRRFVLAFRSVSPRFRFEWAPNIGGGDDPARSYPGDDVVDVIGMDAYYNTRWDPADATIAWLKTVERPYGFRWLEAFAAAHRKPTAYGEWGVMSDGAGPYVARAAAWFEARRPLYQAYWNSDSSFRGRLSEGRLPAAAAAYRTAFGGCRPAAG